MLAHWDALIPPGDLLEERMSCCAEQVFERHANPDIADIGSGGGAEYTVGSCRNCGAVLIHCWTGGVVGGVVEVTRELVDSFLAAPLAERKKLLGHWFNS
jgi:hypothetical protein